MAYESWIANPPQGYQFLTSQRVEDSVARLLAKTGFAYRLQGFLQKRGVPTDLTKAYLGRFRQVPSGTDLTIAATHLVFRKEPWVLDMQTEMPAVLVGPELHYHRYKGIVRRALLSPYCKKIITYITIGKWGLAKSLNCDALEQKTEVVYSTVSRKAFTKSYNKKKVKLLFITSANILGQFELKGGKEALETFVDLRRRYPDLELVVRSDIPAAIKKRFHGVDGLRIIEKRLPWEQLEREFQTADIFLFPSHVATNRVLLDAMSYELPIVTTNAWGNAELVDDGRTGFIVPKSSLALEFPSDAPWGHSRDFGKKVVRQVDPRMVEALVEKVSLLIANPELRQRMGRAGRWEIEEGKFSILRRNEALKRVLDEATEGKN